MSQVTESILFRQKLYQNFKQSGLLSKIKTTVRSNLLQKLQKPISLQREKASYKQQQQKSKPLYLRDKFLACIVKEYLSKTQKQYTMSILLPQSNLSLQDCLNYNELSKIINLCVPESNQKKSFLQTLVQQWTKFRATQIHERSTQTDFSDPVSKKLQDIQKGYRSKIDYWKLIPNPKKQQNQCSSIQLLAKQERLRQQLQLQKKNMKRDLQLMAKAQMQKKYESQYQFKVREIEKAHQGRLNQIKSRQKSIIQSLQRKTKQLQEKARQMNEKEMSMIKKYQNRVNELQIQHRNKIKQLQKKQKQIWKKQLQIKSKKRQYEDTIKLVKEKVIEQTINLQ